MILNRQRKVRFQRAELNAFLTRLEDEVMKKREFDIAIVSDAVIRRYNKRFRAIDKSTDVLSFEPSDIMISAETASRQGKSFGHGVEAEIKVLALHGALHLLGHDHEKDGGKMARLEQRWRKRLGLPIALTERRAD